MTSFNYQQEIGQAALLRMSLATPGVVAIAGSDWAQGAMTALIQAEQLAAQAGVVPFIVDPVTGSRGVVNVGAARALASKMPIDVRTIYLATYGAVRQANAASKRASSSTPLLSGLSTVRGMLDMGELGVIPIAVVVIACVGLAALIAGAAYVESVKIEVDGQNLRQAAAVSNIATLATAQLAATGKIDPSVWSSLTTIAQAEGATSSIGLPLILGAGVAVAGAGYFGWRRWFR